MKVILSIKPHELASMLLCTSTDETRYVICGVLIEYQDGELRAVATDGRRLAVFRPEWEITYSTPKDTPFAFIIPREVIELIPMHDARNVPWELTFSNVNQHEKTVTLSNGNFEIKCPAIDGNYPKYRQLIPDKMPANLSQVSTWMNPHAFVDIVKMLHNLEDVKHANVRQESELTPIYILSDRTTVVLMPVRVSGTPHNTDIPEFN